MGPSEAHGVWYPGPSFPLPPQTKKIQKCPKNIQECWKNTGGPPGTSPEKSEQVQKNVSEDTPRTSREHISMVPKPPGNTPGTSPKK